MPMRSACKFFFNAGKKVDASLICHDAFLGYPGLSFANGGFLGGCLLIDCSFDVDDSVVEHLEAINDYGIELS